MRSPQKGNYPFDKGASRPQKRKYKSKVIKDKKSLETPLIEKFGVFLSENTVEIILPIRTVSEANCFESWQKKHARHKKQKFAVQSHLNLVVNKITLPCEITLTRFASRSLDLHDNLPYSFKFISDSIADLLIPGKKSGFADSDQRLTWKYSQIKSKTYAIRIKIKSLA